MRKMRLAVVLLLRSLNESPSEKEGKSSLGSRRLPRRGPLNESPSEKEGKYARRAASFPTWRGPQ